jgi:hypothetical protein
MQLLNPTQEDLLHHRQGQRLPRSEKGQAVVDEMVVVVQAQGEAGESEVGNVGGPEVVADVGEDVGGKIEKCRRRGGLWWWWW